MYNINSMQCKSPLNIKQHQRKHYAAFIHYFTFIAFSQQSHFNKPYPHLLLSTVTHCLQARLWGAFFQEYNKKNNTNRNNTDTKENDSSKRVKWLNFFVYQKEFPHLKLSQQHLDSEFKPHNGFRDNFLQVDLISNFIYFIFEASLMRQGNQELLL